jgi:ATP-binding cassette, subfamily G (WHITE), member 2, SNQ2
MATTPADSLTLDDSKPYTPSEALRDSVNTIQAKEEFNELVRKLSRKSARHDSHDSSSPQTIEGRDIEKTAGDLEDTFDLREYLTSSNDANQAAGIKHKHVGESTCFRQVRSHNFVSYRLVSPGRTCRWT